MKKNTPSKKAKAAKAEADVEAGSDAEEEKPKKVSHLCPIPPQNSVPGERRQEQKG